MIGRKIVLALAAPLPAFGKLLHKRVILPSAQIETSLSDAIKPGAEPGNIAGPGERAIFTAEFTYDRESLRKALDDNHVVDHLGMSMVQNQPFDPSGRLTQTKSGDSEKDVACQGDWFHIQKCSDDVKNGGCPESIEAWLMTKSQRGNGAGCPMDINGKLNRRVKEKCKCDCVGEWRRISWDAPTRQPQCENCGTYTMKYSVLTPAAEGGKQCPHNDGDTKEEPCPCKVDCVGYWYKPERSDCIPCSRPGFEKFKVVVEQRGTGKHCEAKHEQEKEITCPCNKDCMEEWTATECKQHLMGVFCINGQGYCKGTRTVKYRRIAKEKGTGRKCIFQTDSEVTFEQKCEGD